MAIKFWTVGMALAMSVGASSAHAGQICQTADRTTRLEVTSYWLQGFTVKLSSPEVSQYYLESSNLKIDSLESVMDPESGRAVTEVSNEGYQFMVYAPNSGTDAVWGLQFAASSDGKAKVVLSDMNGKAFAYDLTCKQTPDLE